MWKNNKHWITFILIAIVAILIWRSTFYIIPFFAVKYFPGINAQYPTYGEIGDMFGAVNAIFSGLAFAGIIITILLQKTELSEQRKELTETRNEFQVNRFTNLIFKQIERIDSTVRVLEIKNYNGDVYKGTIGIYLLNQWFMPFICETTEKKKNINHELKSINWNSRSIIELSTTLEDSSKIFLRIVQNSDLENSIKKDLAYVYYNNVGEEIKSFVENVYHVLRYNIEVVKNSPVKVDAKILEIVTNAKNQIDIINKIIT